jgi:hypothetical protein
VPGLTPSSLASTVGPVLVTVDPASTEKFAAVPSSGVGDELALAPTASASVSAAMTMAEGTPIPTADLRIRERMAQPISVTGMSKEHRMQPATVHCRNRDAHASAIQRTGGKGSAPGDNVCSINDRPLFCRRNPRAT